MIEREWSKFQKAIFEDVATGKGNTVVQARAGSGKTSTVVESLKYIPKGRSTLMVAFNKSIAAELSQRAPSGVEVKTLHGLGFAAVRQAYGKVRVDEGKGTLIAREVADRFLAKIKDKLEKEFDEAAQRQLRRDLPYTVAKMASLAKGYLAETDVELDKIVDKHELVIPEIPGCSPIDFDCPRKTVFPLVREALARASEDTNSVDFDDMIWLPIRNRLETKKFDRVFVDECQDLNNTQIKLALGSVFRSGRICAVGDNFQAVYAFRGAAEDAMDQVINGIQAKVLPLSITYRCAKAIVRVVQPYVPDLEAAPNVAEGIVREDSEERMVKDIRPGDFLISRVNAPLVRLCMMFLRQGRPAAIQGRDVGARLLGLIKKSNASSVDELHDWIHQWMISEIKRLEKKGRSTEGVEDTAECLYTLCEGMPGVEAVKSDIEKLFSDKDEANRIVLTSTHKAKGLERDRVFMLRDTYLRKNKSGAVEQEERNLFYVACTRAKNELVFVKGVEGRKL